jgi:hypothetical protein
MMRGKMLFKSALISVFFLALLVLPADDIYAQPRLSEDETVLSNSMKDEIIDTLLNAFNRYYAFPEIAADLEKAIREKQSQKAYADITDFRAFVRQLSKDFRETTNDLHVAVSVMSEEDFYPSVGDTLTEAKIAKRARQNFGFRKLEWLQGNIGYLDLRQFDDPSYAGARAAAAMNFLADCDAVIIDLRQNGGGEPDMVQYLCSYFFAKPRLLNSLYEHRGDSLHQSWTLAYVPGKKLLDTDLYILTSARTASGAEEFCYNMKHNQRATLIGETTAGAGHMVDFFDFPNLKIRAKISTGWPVNPHTGTNWEQVGVIPHIEVSAEKALKTAYREALAKLAKETEDERARYDLNWALAEVEAELNPVELDAAVLINYTGKFGPIEIVYENGGLCALRGDERYTLQPLAKDLFRVSEIDFVRLKIEVDNKGKASKITQIFSDGTYSSISKSDN